MDNKLLTLISSGLVTKSETTITPDTRPSRIKVSILDIIPVTHDVKCFRLQKPPGYTFIPGQATDVSINKEGWQDILRPFTFTALSDQPYLEFTIKRYESHQGVTNYLHQLAPGDQLFIGEPWGAISYNGPGYFIAGGAGITPFIAILRSLSIQDMLKGNTLLLSNKKAEDIIYEEELAAMEELKIVFTLTREERTDYHSGHIDKSFTRETITDFKKQFYICGPDKMVTDVAGLLAQYGVSSETIVFEK